MKTKLTEKNLRQMNDIQRHIVLKQWNIHQHDTYEVDYDVTGEGDYLKGFTVMKNVFCPFASSARYHARFLFYNSHYFQDKTVFDIGCGSGILGVVMAEYGAKKVVLSDVSKPALENTNYNVEKFGLQRICDVRESNLFSNISEKADLIVWNIPFFKGMLLPQKTLQLLKENVFHMVRKYPVDLLFKYVVLFAFGLILFILALVTSGLFQAILMVVFIGYIIFLTIVKYFRKKNIRDMPMWKLYVGLVLMIICLSFLIIDGYSFITSSVEIETDKAFYDFNDSAYVIFNPVGFTNKGINKITLNKNISLFDAGEGVRSGPQYVYIQAEKFDKNKTTQDIKVYYRYKRALFFEASKTELFRLPYKLN